MSDFRAMGKLGFAIAIIPLIGLCGCLKVDPKTDYQHVQELARRSTGVADMYAPTEDDIAIGDRVRSILDAGLTVDGAVQISLLNNPDFQAAWMSVGMAKADLVQSQLLSNPTLALSMRFQSGGGSPDVDAGLAQNIMNILQLPIRKKLAQHQLEVAVHTLARKAHELSVDTRERYYRAVSARRALAISDENAATARQLLDLAQVRHNAGAVSEIEVNLSRQPVLESELALMSARLQKEEADRDLARVLGLRNPELHFELKDELPTPPDIELHADRLLDVARDFRLDLRAAEEAIVVAETALRQQHWMMFPEINLGIETERSAQQSQGSRNVLADTARASIANGGLTAPAIQPRSERARQRRIDRNNIITGPTLSMPLPIFDQNQAQIAKAVFSYQQAAKNFDALDRALVHDVSSALEQAQTASKISNYYRDQSIPLSTRNLELSRESYRAGRSSLLEVLEVQRFLLDTRSKFVDAAQSAAFRIAELERTIGLPMREIVDELAKNAEVASPPTRGAWTGDNSTEPRP
ncbi:MAG: TolC family protein [Planctomycetes bacterium]|nr:TolC family protein [Planctomycetota bacterium]MBI3833072.1 TolC family protein [Planctomycetota bacterium]